MAWVTDWWNREALDLDEVNAHLSSVLPNPAPLVDGEVWASAREHLSVVRDTFDELCARCGLHGRRAEHVPLGHDPTDPGDAGQYVRAFGGETFNGIALDGLVQAVAVPWLRNTVALKDSDSITAEKAAVHAVRIVAETGLGTIIQTAVGFVERDRRDLLYRDGNLRMTFAWQELEYVKKRIFGAYEHSNGSPITMSSLVEGLVDELRRGRCGCADCLAYGMRSDHDLNGWQPSASAPTLADWLTGWFCGGEAHRGIGASPNSRIWSDRRHGVKPAAAVTRLTNLEGTALAKDWLPDPAAVDIDVAPGLVHDRVVPAFLVAHRTVATCPDCKSGDDHAHRSVLVLEADGHCGWSVSWDHPEHSPNTGWCHGCRAYSDDPERPCVHPKHDQPIDLETMRHRVVHLMPEFDECSGEGLYRTVQWAFDTKAVLAAASEPKARPDGHLGVFAALIASVPPPRDVDVPEPLTPQRCNQAGQELASGLRSETFRDRLASLAAHGPGSGVLSALLDLLDTLESDDDQEVDHAFPSILEAVHEHRKGRIRWLRERDLSPEEDVLGAWRPIYWTRPDNGRADGGLLEDCWGAFANAVRQQWLNGDVGL